MPTIFQRKHSKKIDLNSSNKTVSTFLIPNQYIAKLKKICPYKTTKKGKRIYQFDIFLNRMIQRYRGIFALGAIPFNKKAKLLYQESGQNLKIFKFRPNDDDWFELGILSYGMGVTRCWLFTYMLKLELSLFKKFISHPLFKVAVTIPRLSRPRLIHQIFGRRRYIHRILHFRI